MAESLGPQDSPLNKRALFQASLSSTYVATPHKSYFLCKADLLRVAACLDQLRQLQTKQKQQKKNELKCLIKQANDQIAYNKQQINILKKRVKRLMPEQQREFRDLSRYQKRLHSSMVEQSRTIKRIKTRQAKALSLFQDQQLQYQFLQIKEKVKTARTDCKKTLLILNQLQKAVNKEHVQIYHKKNRIAWLEQAIGGKDKRLMNLGKIILHMKKTRDELQKDQNTASLNLSIKLNELDLKLKELKLQKELRRLHLESTNSRLQRINKCLQE